MFRSSDILNNIYPDTNFSTPISASQVLLIRAGTRYDAAWSYRSAVLALVSALQGLGAGNRSWPVVQLYYSTFYSIRSILYSNEICIYYCGKKPVQAYIRPGELPVQLRFQGASSSHIAAARVFRTRLPLHPLSGEIDFLPALDWLRSLREATNYNEPMMNLDDRFKLFDRILSYSLRSALNTYLDDLNLYAFLPEDAAVAFPIFAAQQALSSLHSVSSHLISAEVKRVIGRLKDKRGAIKCMEKLTSK